MQDEVKNTIDVFFFVNEGRVRFGMERWYSPNPLSSKPPAFHFIYRSFNHLYTGILDNLSQVSMFSKARWAILGYPDDPVVERQESICASHLHRVRLERKCTRSRRLCWQVLAKPRDVVEDNSIIRSPLFEQMLIVIMACAIRRLFLHRRLGFLNSCQD